MYEFDIPRYTQEIYDGWVDPRQHALKERLSNKKRRSKVYCEETTSKKLEREV